ncbi:MAG: flagellar basal body-associated FliL family protein [Defluviitaleaceae bacterium]|nr:flagellar basal body-associated FliL family protein [Defluviitaleaceae bacterium]
MDKSKLMMIIIIALLVLLLGTVIGVGVYLITISNEDPTPFHDPGRVVVNQDLTPSDMIFVQLGELMTANLAPGPNNRSDIIRLEVTVGLNAHPSVDEDELEDFYGVMTRGIPAARAEVFNVLITRTYEELRTLEGRLAVEEIMKHQLQDLFSSNLIVDVSFSDVIVSRGR